MHPFVVCLRGRAAGGNEAGHEGGWRRVVKADSGAVVGQKQQRRSARSMSVTKLLVFHGADLDGSGGNRAPRLSFNARRSFRRCRAA